MKKNLDIEYIASRCELNEESSCWEWQGMTRPDGYGIFRNNGKQILAHRGAYFASRYEWPELCRHMCDNRICCNPLHLANGTQADNVRDRDERNRNTWHRGAANANSKLSPDDYPKILNMRESGMSQQQIGDALSVGQTLISRVLAGYHWICPS